MDDMTPEERHEFTREIAIIARRWRVRLDERLAELDLSQARWVALHWLGQAPDGLSQSALAELTAVEAPTLTRVIDQLEKLQMVERRHSATDRRVNMIRLTDTSRSIMAQSNEIIEDLRQEVMADISEAELAQAMSVLKRMRVRLDRAPHA